MFFAGSGSEAVDTALKIALAYWNVSGKGSKTRLIGRERGYHGVGFGGISVGGMVNNRKFFGSLLTGIDHLPATYDREKQAFSKGEPDYGAHFADDLERIVTLHDASTIAAVIVEPMAGSTGALPPPKGYLKRLREICDKHGILLIFDEVITGFGRLGTAFAAERYGVVPDIVTFAKGVTSGTVPMGGVVVRKHIYEAFMGGPDNVIELFHGYTYSGHPLAAAASLAALDIYRDEGLFERAKALEPLWADTLMSLKDEPNVVDIRTLGLVAGIDLAPRADGVGKRGFEAMDRGFHEEGLMIAHRRRHARRLAAADHHGKPDRRTGREAAPGDPGGGGLRPGNQPSPSIADKADESDARVKIREGSTRNDTSVPTGLPGYVSALRTGILERPTPPPSPQPRRNSSRPSSPCASAAGSA